MGLSSLKISLDFDEQTVALTCEEKMQLLSAMLHYAKTEEEPKLTGAVRIIWPVFKVEIDKEISICNTWAENGKKGGRPKKAETDTNQINQTEPNETQLTEQNQINQTKPNKPIGFREKESERESEEDKEKERSKEIETEEEKEKEKEKETHRAREAAAERRSLFDRFWDDYPRKEGKKSALKEWEKIRPGPELFQEIMTSLKKQKNSEQWRRDGGQYIPHPSTWLHGERWKDETIQGCSVIAAQDYGQRDYIGIQDEVRRRMITAMMDEPAAAQDG